ncbi:DUF302 domain-containing protein [Polycladomyces subterraneus]|uniref:DUF302 domain-containing protein n=1 Tax=Polycladomyces subterraneus TaxID=1016997 RepID=A0ABT8INM8_9BACL|nr:DUF302 domain-containing protein [Polycladomyces subterraneus]MDN4594375.1 DUF302 domain-containing protein [Polycladomyces subterraneus]
MFHYTVETEKTVDEAVHAVEEACAKRKFGVLWQLDIPTKLLEKGIHFDQSYRVLEVCNPDITKKALIHNQQAGHFLPCKIVVYTDVKTGKTKIGLSRPTALFALMEDEHLLSIAKEVESALIHALDEAKD